MAAPLLTGVTFAREKVPFGAGAAAGFFELLSASLGVSLVVVDDEEADDMVTTVAMAVGRQRVFCAFCFLLFFSSFSDDERQLLIFFKLLGWLVGWLVS